MECGCRGIPLGVWILAMVVTQLYMCIKLPRRAHHRKVSSVVCYRKRQPHTCTVLSDRKPQLGGPMGATRRGHRAEPRAAVRDAQQGLWAPSSGAGAPPGSRFPRLQASRTQLVDGKQPPASCGSSPALPAIGVLHPGKPRAAAGEDGLSAGRGHLILDC